MRPANMLTAFAGDWHGNTHWARRCLMTLATEGCRTVYHLGDFGLWPGGDGKDYLTRVHRALEENDQNIFIVLGNHEDYDRVSLMHSDDAGWLYLKNYPRMRFAPRGHVWLDGDTRMAALGGATSIDRRLRKPGQSWWSEEEITKLNVDSLVANVVAKEWERVDVLLTHDAPAGLRRVGMTPKPEWFTEEIEHDAWSGRLLLREAADSVCPRWLIHGHWHAYYRDTLEGIDLAGRDYTCEVIGLADDGNPHNILTAQLEAGVGLSHITTPTVLR